MKQQSPRRLCDTKLKPARKVIIKYFSDESLNDNAPAQGQEEYSTLRRIKTQVTLTLPTGPHHLMVRESFQAFFVNHGLTRAL